MSKASRVQIEVTVTGDGVQSINRPTAQDNATPPAGGPQRTVVAAGAGNTPLTPPSGALGMLITPAETPLADLWLSYYAPPLGVPLDPTKAHFIAIPTGTTTVHVGSTLGGDIFVQWT